MSKSVGRKANLRSCLYLFAEDYIDKTKMNMIKNKSIDKEVVWLLGAVLEFIRAEKLGRKVNVNIAFARGGSHLPIAHALRLLSTKELRFGLTKLNSRKNNFLK